MMFLWLIIVFILGTWVGIGLMCIVQVSKKEENLQNGIRVIKWISYDKASELIEIGVLYDNNIGGLGGWFKEEQRWKDYKMAFKEAAHPYIEALREDIVLNNIRHCGNDHQELENGVPVFSDFSVSMYSYRAWGDLMAAIWSTQENKDYSYMDFYMSL
ncbi:MAG: hypothetical protein IJE05_01810 [Clostridia bacterium]|nr:hypothetical protein [Clostridia bacterium]